jgi:hypothetical protein
MAASAAWGLTADCSGVAPTWLNPKEVQQLLPTVACPWRVACVTRDNPMASVFRLNHYYYQ